MKGLSNTAIGAAGGLALLAGIGWAGLQVPPTNLAMTHGAPQDLGTLEVPEGLPAPVARFYAEAYGPEVPRVESLVVYGRGRANFGIWLPLRYRLAHRSGYAFQRDMEVTWFGLPILRAVDRYMDGRGMTGPLGHEATGPAVDQGANMILWAEAPLMPSLWISDDRIYWETIDDEAARLHFPYEDEHAGDELIGDTMDELIVHFDPRSGLVAHITAHRYRDAESGKIPWRVDFLTWQTINGIQLPARVAVTWADQGKPWSYWDFEHVFWNVELTEALADVAPPQMDMADRMIDFGERAAPQNMPKLFETAVAMHTANSHIDSRR